MSLTITWKLNIKDVRCKPRLHDLVLAGVWPPCCAMSSLDSCAAIHAASYVDHEKRVAWVSISMHVCDPVPMVMALRLAALWSAQAPLIFQLMMAQAPAETS